MLTTDDLHLIAFALQERSRNTAMNIADKKEFTELAKKVALIREDFLHSRSAYGQIPISQTMKL